MTPHICDHILQPAQGCSCSKHCLELLPAPFPLPWEPWRCLTPREWNIHTLWVRFPCCPLCSPSRCILMRLGAGSGSRAAVWALCSWDSSFPPLPLYSHTAGAAVGCEHMEAEVQKWGCRDFSFLQVPWDGALLFNMCVFERKSLSRDWALGSL